MNEHLVAIIAYFALLISGYATLDLIFSKALPVLEKVGLAFSAGSIIYITIVFIQLIIGVEWNFVPILITILIVVLFWLLKKPDIPKLSIRFNIAQKLLLALIICSLLFPAIESFFRPLIAWDGIASWFMGAKGLFILKGFYPEFYNQMFFDFPPAVHLILLYPSLILEKFSEVGGLSMFNFISFSITILFFSMLKRKTSLTYALFFTFLFVSTQNVIRHTGYLDVGHVDIVVSYFILCSASLIPLIFNSKKMRIVIIYGLVLTLVALSKNEGLAFAVSSILVMSYMLIRTKNLTLLKGLIPGIIIIICWLNFKTMNIHNPPFSLENDLHLLQIHGILLNMGKEMLNIARWNIGWIFISIVLLFIRKTKEQKIILLICGIQLLFYLGAYIASPLNPIEHVNTSFDRLLLQLYPLLLCVAAESFALRNKYNVYDKVY